MNAPANAADYIRTLDADALRRRLIELNDELRATRKLLRVAETAQRNQQRPPATRQGSPRD